MQQLVTKPQQGLLTLKQFHQYQQTMVNFQVNHIRSMIWGFMGSGKTIVTLTTAWHLLQHGLIRGVLVLAPLRVVQSVWEKEARKWEHTKDLTFSTITGPPDRRMSALFQQADVYLTNYENLQWLNAQLQAYFIQPGNPMPFDMLVVDEISKMKNSNTVRMESLLPLLPAFTYRTGLTGTPAPNGYIDLHGQYLVIDDGVRLGTEKSAYENAYFKSCGHMGYSHQIADNANEIIERNISDITLEMAEEDYLELPDLMMFDIHAHLPPGARKKYNQMEKDLFAEMDDGSEVEVTSEVAKINKLLQMSNGAIYTNPETREWKKLHDSKLDVLEDILEEAAGQPVLLGYNFRTDAARICKRFKFAVNLNSLNSKEFNQAIQDFAAGRIRLLIGHPQSFGHGTDGLQYGGSILVWYGLPWSLEYYLQFNKRIHRQGQGKPVTCYRILAPDTMDEAVAIKLGLKDDTQKALRAAVGEYRKNR